MNIIDFRKSPRRALTTQSKEDRRKVVHSFGSPEWLQYINDKQADCPKHDRRQAEKQTDNRQLSDRRGQFNEESINSLTHDTRIFLTRAERRIVEDVYLGDF